jgi:SPP1 gp7 family putative phage head morphogenesis protein
MIGPDDLPPAGVAPEEAIAFFRAKGFRIGFNWQDVFKTEHVRAFTVAKAMSRSLLETIREEVDRAIADGTTLADFQKALRPKLEAAGWWGKKRMIDPLTAQSKVVQLGSPKRLKTIFDTNLRSAYNAGKWERGERVKDAFPFLEYSTMEDEKVRHSHAVWDGTILPRDDPWWDTHHPLSDWNDRCTATPRSQRMLDRQGKAVTGAPPVGKMYQWTNTRTGETGWLEEGIGKGWDYNAGKEYLRGLAPTPLPESFGKPDHETGAAADLSRAELLRVDRFLGRFGVDAGGEVIWTDRDGWPLSIGCGWFIAENGDIRMPAPAMLDRIASAIVTPDSIRWIWVKAEDGRMVLMRRYERGHAGLATIVDVGGVGWRWSIGRGE